MKVKSLLKLFYLCLIFLFILTSCHSYKIKTNISADERFELAKTMFKNKDYFDAKTQFKILTLNNPGAKYIDEAQYFLGECHFNMKEYILAADEYNRLLRKYPRSQWIDDAQFKIAFCDFKLSPKPSLDQKYTLEAVENFQRFLEDFPDSELRPEAEKMLKMCRTKLAEKDFKTGELYRKLSDHYAALVYFNSVLESYYDTKFAQAALFWKGESLYKLDRKTEAAEVFKEFIQKYTRSKYRMKAIERFKELKVALKSAHETDGDASSKNKFNN
ncbi:MAG: outer membrane protein assembly factor BamD [bacterium]